MTDTLKSVIEDELQKAYERGVQDGMKCEHAMWELAKIGQEIELGISYEEANPPEPYCKRCGKKLGTEAHDVHTCTPIKEWVGLTDDEIEGAIDDGFAFGLDDGNVSNEYVIRYARAIEAKLKEKNT